MLTHTLELKNQKEPRLITLEYNFLYGMKVKKMGTK